MREIKLIVRGKSAIERQDRTRGTLRGRGERRRERERETNAQIQTDIGIRWREMCRRESERERQSE